MKYNEKIVALRKANGFTQEGFARAVGVTRQAVYKWEVGDSYPEAEKLIAIKMLFGISIDDLLDDSFDVIVEKAKKPARRKTIPPSLTNAAPAVEEKPAPIEEVAPVVEEKVAPVEEAAPVVEEKVAPVEEVAPAVEEATPAVEEAAPAVEEAAPAPAAKAVEDDLDEFDFTVTERTAKGSGNLTDLFIKRN